VLGAVLAEPEVAEQLLDSLRPVTDGDLAGDGGGDELVLRVLVDVVGQVAALADPVTSDADRSAGPEGPDEGAQQGRLSAPVGADDGDELSGADRETDLGAAPVDADGVQAEDRLVRAEGLDLRPLLAVSLEVSDGGGILQGR